MKSFFSDNMRRKLLSFSICSLLSFSTLLQTAPPVYATETTAEASAPTDYMAEQEARKLLPVQSNEIENWPAGPIVGAQGAILVEANTGTILYAKNIHEKLYPASTTKILSTLVDIENSNLDDMVTFSKNAVYSIEPGSSNMGMDVGESITMEQCLYGILVHSANEVANAAAEHVAGSIDKFVEMMNEKAKELGCTESHFMTTNGLHDENHYTTPYDLSLIAKAFFSNETLCKMSNTPYYVIPPTATQPDEIPCYTHNQMVRGKYPYEYLVGSKTGYTSMARQTLVSCAQKDGMKLICVVMKEESPEQFLDTISLFDYGFNNFHMVNIAENETTYTVNASDFFDTDNDIFGSSAPLMSIDPTAYVVIPNTIDFKDMTSSLTYDSKEDTAIATIQYSYQDVPLGKADINLEEDTKAASYTFDSDTPEEVKPEQENIIFINVAKVAAIAGGVLILILLIVGLIHFFKNYNFNSRRRGYSGRADGLNFGSSRKKSHRRNRTPRYKRRDSYKDIDFR